MKKLILSMTLLLSAGNAFSVVSQPVITGGVQTGTSTLSAIPINLQLPGGYIPGSYEDQCLRPMNIGGEAAREWMEKCDRMRQQMGMTIQRG